jgi:hypothetical protein
MPISVAVMTITDFMNSETGKLVFAQTKFGTACQKLIMRSTGKGGRLA